MRTRVAAAAVVLAVAAVGCSSGSSDGVQVVSTKTGCTAAKTRFDAGKTTFRVVNKGSDVTELYVYAPGDKTVGEVENVGPNTSRTLTVTLAKGGRYELACKPGETGKGIRVPITVND